MKRSISVKSLAVRGHGGAGSCSREWKDVAVVWGYCTRFEFHVLGISNICIGAQLPFVGGGGGRGGNRENRAPRALISSTCPPSHNLLSRSITTLLSSCSNRSKAKRLLDSPILLSYLWKFKRSAGSHRIENRVRGHQEKPDRVFLHILVYPRSLTGSDVKLR